ncbi:tRNA lysidine(34) synthetase TilS [Thermoflavimicrobium daqui]|jgi:tRNA(Ile)-lysidine synthase|uniref:tRNA(Ile)-lysidine synthase n=1 Tax=Thermoflavimicrobium daqui TaxID=2137476 RepID=A0A364K2X2_9BACL|nr:tRNA lysidine(34) synthetase TilS [Thermoflavimicrobium daqui]RAL23187.1 tRNA lysidine(34) synthetase TilS [Thermoflavimicrobium daqui]
MLFLKQLEKEITKYHLLSPDERVLVGVSGGPDSMALLSGLQQLSAKNNWHLYVIHVNHQLRGQESEEDAEYVENYCLKWQIPYRIECVDVMAALESGGNSQSVARRLRYEAFQRAAKHLQIRTLALAHHADDQVETILMRFLRGTGVAGLSGMAMSRQWQDLKIIRPLLQIRRKEIEHYLEEQKIMPRQDQSNFSLKYTRNRVRLKLIPELMQYNSNVQEAILQLGDIVTEEEKVWKSLVQEALSKVLVQDKLDRTGVNIRRLLNLPIALQRRVVKLILSCLVNDGTSELTHEAVERIRDFARHPHPSGTIHLPHGIRIYREYEVVWFTTRDLHEEEWNHSQGKSVTLKIPGVTKIPELGGAMEVKVTSEPLNNYCNHSFENVAVFDADDEILKQPILIRSRMPGDRMTCLGMKGTKKVKKILMEAKIPRHKRGLQPVVIAGDQILWIVGTKRSNIAPVSSETKRFLYFIWHVVE